MGQSFAKKFQSKVEMFKICYNYELTQSKCKMSPLSGVRNVGQTGQENGGVISTNSMDKRANKETVHRQLGIHDSKYNSSIQCTAKKWHDQSRASAHLICPTTHEEGHHNRWKGRKHDNAQLNIRSRRLHLVCEIQNITWACGDMEFLFECSTQYQVQHKKRNSISPSNHVSFCLLYKHLTNKKKPT